MSWFSHWARRSPILSFFVLVFATEWLLVLTLGPRMSPLVALLVGSWLPNIAGLLVTAIADGEAGLRNSLGKFAVRRTHLRWYAIATMGPVAVAFLASALYVLAGNAAPPVVPLSMMLPLLVFNAILGPMGEELGWRGTALPRLQVRWGVLTSSLVLGALWGLYHLPAFYMPGLPRQSVPPLAFMAGAVGFSVFISWLFNRTGQSLLVASLSHLAFNMTGSATGLYEAPTLFGLTAGVWLVLAAAIIVFDWASSPGLGHQQSKA